jgi:hypothetical protein
MPGGWRSFEPEQVSESAPELPTTVPSVGQTAPATQKLALARALPKRDDELVPFEQNVVQDAELTRVGHPHEFYTYEGLKHCFSTSADNATTQQTFQDSLGCLRRALANS